jgi:hypothetical protein
MKMIVSLLLLSLVFFTTVYSSFGFSHESAITQLDDEKKEKKEEKKHFPDYIYTSFNRTPQLIGLGSTLSNTPNLLIPSSFSDKKIQPPDHCC